MTRTKPVPVPSEQGRKNEILQDVADGRRTLDQAHAELDRLESRPPGVPLSKPGCFEARVGLKDEMVDALDAIQLRTVLAARMVC